MSQLLDSLASNGVNLAETDSSVSQASAAIESFNQMNLSPSSILAAASQIPQTIGGITGLGSIIPQLGRIPIITSKISNLLAYPNMLRTGVNGEWESTHYADDLNKHHAKYKFLFKVLFEGFGVEKFYCFVHKCDKPKVKFNHQDVNYYNFRTRVLTSTTFEPMNMSFLDEIGNSVNTFFVQYLKTRSGMGSGEASIATGFGVSSSSKPYTGGYADKGTRITIEQIFGNGTKTNRFTFKNARIESFDFDDLSMEENAGSMMNMTFTYDAIIASTIDSAVAYRWGQTDIHAGGGTSGPENAGGDGSTSYSPVSATGKTIGSTIKDVQSGLLATVIDTGKNIITVSTTVPAFVPQALKGGMNALAASGNAVNNSIQNTLNAFASGGNVKNLGSANSTINNLEPPAPINVFSNNIAPSSQG